MAASTYHGSGNPFENLVTVLPTDGRLFWKAHCHTQSGYFSNQLSGTVITFRFSKQMWRISWTGIRLPLNRLEIPFKPARILLQDCTGVPSLVDLAAMRDAIRRLGSAPQKINPMVPVELVVDHSVEVAVARAPNALQKNMDIEIKRNKERCTFIKWGATAFNNMLVVPPGSGIVHQVNLEYLAQVIFNRNGVLCPDSLVGIDSHTTMINGLIVAGWGVGGIEAEAGMLGEVCYSNLPGSWVVTKYLEKRSGWLSHGLDTSLQTEKQLI